MTEVAIRAIETEYAGCRFRSRLEARWAVFMDHMGIRWIYEPQGLEFDGIKYLPDFYLPDLDGGLFLEVKGIMDKKSARKMLGLAGHRMVLLALDVPRPGVRGPHFGLFRKFRGAVVGYNVSLLPRTVEPLTWTVRPFGWETVPFDVDNDGSLSLFVQFVEAFEGDQGWVESNYVVDDAFAAARSARFEFGERG